MLYLSEHFHCMHGQQKQIIKSLFSSDFQVMFLLLRPKTRFSQWDNELHHNLNVFGAVVQD